MRLAEGPTREKVQRGGWILAVLAAAALGTFAVDEIQRELAAGTVLWITAEETRSIRPGAPVWLAGHRVGRVSRVTIRSPASAAERRALVRAVLRDEAAGRMRSDAAASIEPSGIMAPPVVALRPGSPGAPPYDFADTLHARPAVTSAELRARAERARAALDTLRRSEDRLLALADTGGGTLARWRSDAELRGRLRRLGGELSRAAERARGGRSTASRVAGDGDPVADLRESLADAEGLAARAEDAAGRWSGLAARLSSLRSRAERLERALSEARGSAGRFAHDEALARELEKLRAQVRSVQAALLADPFAWLRLGLF